MLGVGLLLHREVQRDEDQHTGKKLMVKRKEASCACDNIETIAGLHSEKNNGVI